MEGNHHETDYSIISKPAEKFIQIDSIFIDLFSSDDKSDDLKYEHYFSIRDYVSDKRKKDRKICWPFPDLDQHLKWRRGQSRQENSGRAAKIFVSDCCHNLGHFPSVLERAPKQDVISGRKVDANASSTLSCRPSCHGDNEENLEVAYSSIPALKRQSQPGCVSHEVTAIKPDNGNLQVPDESRKPTANFQAGKQTPGDHQDRQLMLMVSEIQSMTDADHAEYAVKFRTNGDPSIELNETTSAASHSAETVGNYRDECHLKLHHRKNRKFRLLAELLEENGNMRDKNVERPANGMADPSAESDVSSASRFPITSQGNIWNLDTFRKRRLPLDEKCRHEEIPSLCNRDKKIQTKKSRWSSCKLDGNHIVSKNNSKRSQVVDPGSISLLPSGDNDRYEIPETLQYRSDGEELGSAVVRVHHNKFSARIPPSTSLNALEPKSRSYKNPNPSKEPEFDEGPTNLFLWNNGKIRKDSVTQQDVRSTKNKVIVTSPFRYANYESNETEPQLSLKNYFNPQRYYEEIVPRGENELHNLLPELNDSSRVIKVTRKDTRKNYLRDPYPLHNASDVGREHTEINSKMTNFRVPLRKRNLDLHTDEGWSQLQQKDIYSGSNVKKTIEAQEPLALTERCRVDVASDPGTLDDIPMEIVELMAKNQYERHLHDAENSKHPSKSSNCSRNVQMNDYGHIYRSRRGLLEEPESHKQRPQARNTGNIAIGARNVVKAIKKRPADHFSYLDECHFNMYQPQQTRMLGHNVSIHSQGKQSSGIQCATIGSKGQSYAENINFQGTVVESGPCNSKVQSFVGCADHRPVADQNEEAARVWSSIMPNHWSYVYQRVPAQSTATENFSSSRSFQNVTTQSYQNHHPANLEKHGRNYSTEACSQRIAENPSHCHPNVIELHHQDLAGSLELYSNETTIPAMHLLSLMDAGMQSNAPITAVGIQKSTKKSPIFHPLNGKEFSSVDIGSKKMVDAINYPSPAFYDAQTPEKSHCPSPVAPSVKAPACTFQHNNRFVTDSDFTGQDFLQPRKKICTDPYTRNKGQKSPKSVFRNVIHKSLVGASDSKVFKLKHHMEKKSKDGKLVAHAKTLQSLKSTFEIEICSVNKNPAEFSLPEAGNSYMIGAEDFNFGRIIHSKNRPSSINFIGFKRQGSM